MSGVTAISRIAGLLIFAAAFFLPAIAADKDSFAKFPPLGLSAGGFTLAEGDLFHTGVINGWVCAREALTSPFAKNTHFDPKVGWLLVLLSGWLNFVVPIYLVLGLFRKLFLARRIAAAGALICLVDAWIYFALSHAYPLIGHDLWAGGALLIVAPELTNLWRKPSSL